MTIILYSLFAALFVIVNYYFYKQGKFKNRQNQRAFLVLSGFISAVYIAEIALRLSGVGATYTEIREGRFINPADYMRKSWYAIHTASSVIQLKSPEFDYSRTTNSKGFSDKEWKESKDPDELRIITLGDSFTEGDGAPSDSAYPVILQKLLQEAHPKLKVNVMNAGISGSDPWFEYKKLNDLLLSYKPDFVLYTISGNDLFTDHLNYGGMERFLHDSTVINRVPRHFWMPLYQFSYVFRLVLKLAGYDETLFSASQRKLNETTALTDAIDLSKHFSSLALENNFICVQLLKPGRYEIKNGKFLFDISKLRESTSHLPSYYTFNLLSYYTDSLHINSDNVNAYFWKYDNHHNPAGYTAMAKAVGSYLTMLMNEAVIGKTQ